MSVGFHRSQLVQYMQSTPETLVMEHLQSAIDGDVDAAERLMNAAGNECRGYLAMKLWRCQIAHRAYRAVLGGAWDHDHHWVICYARNRRRLQAMFRYAAFPTDHLPERITVWRGTRNISIYKAAGGYSWTLSRDVACWFAVKHRGRVGTPLVLTADVVRSDVVLSSDNRDEQKVVLTRRPTARVDACPGNWTNAADRHERHIKEEEHARMEEIRRRNETSRDS